MTTPNFRLDHQTALVTGAASGIGRRVAVGLAEAGADVACVDLPGAGLDDVVAEIQRRGRRALALSGDVTEAADLAEAVGRTEAELGSLTLAVNSAGIANAGFSARVISYMSNVVLIASGTVPPTNRTMAGAPAMAKPPSPTVSVMAESPMSGFASSGP